MTFGDCIAYFFRGWNCYTFIPVVLGSFGGLIVGQVVKLCGSVVKGCVLLSFYHFFKLSYSLVFGLLLTSLTEIIVYKAPVYISFLLAVVLAILSMVIHITKGEKRTIKNKID
jgi:hypothetical protein